MPNIHVIGFTRSEYEERLKPLIDRVMQDLGLGSDAITTFWPSTDCQAESCDGARKPMPYIVVRADTLEAVNQIVDALKAADIMVDCEKSVLPENGFISAKDMRRDPLF